MYDEPKITFMCVTYNRVKMLNNLLLSFISVDGDKVSLNHNWSPLSSSRTISVDKGQKSLTYSTRYQGQTIEKKLTFYPDSYNIDIDVLFNQPSEFISRNQYTLGWSGGLPLLKKTSQMIINFLKLKHRKCLMS